MPDWDLVQGMAEDDAGGAGNPDFDGVHDPAGHCGGAAGRGRFSAEWDLGRVFGGPAGAVRCNRCGSTDVRWRQQGGKWVMFSLQPGVEHQCPARVATPDEFA